MTQACVPTQEGLFQLITMTSGMGGGVIEAEIPVKHDDVYGRYIVMVHALMLIPAIIL